MIKHISKVGNSLGITLPTRELHRMGVAQGTPVRIIVGTDRIEILPLSRNPDPALCKLAERDRIANPKFYEVLAN